VVSESAWAAPAAPLRGLIAGYSGYRQHGVPPATHRGLPSPYLTLIITLDDPLTIARHPDPADPPGRRTPRAAPPGRQLAGPFRPPGPGPAAPRRPGPAARRGRHGRVAHPDPLRRHDPGVRAGHGNRVEPALPAAAPAGRDRPDPQGGRPGDAVRPGRRLLQRQAATGEATHLAGLAAQCGYCDQAHLAREFRALAGCAPSAWLAQEFRNFQAVAAGPETNCES